MYPTKFLFYVLCFTLFFSLGCNQQKSRKAMTSEQQRTWDTFLNAIRSADKNEFEKVATRTITCLPCLDNSQEERTQLQSLALSNKKNHLQWIAQNKYVYIKAFLDQDYALFFTPDFIARLQKNHAQVIQATAHDFEVSITPTARETETELVRYTFGFTKKEEGYKLTKINTLSAP